MSAAESNAPAAQQRSRRLIRTSLRILLWTALGLVALAYFAWAWFAITLDGPGRGWATAYVVASVALLAFVRPRRRGRIACAALAVLVLAWWLSIEPRNDRDWLPEVSELPSMHVEGDRLIVENVRDFEYLTTTEFTPRWDERTYYSSRITGVDIVVCDWGEAWIVHTMLSWEFDDGQRLAVSIEARKQVGESYSAVRSFYRQFELYYVVGDERDLIGLRTNVRGEKVRLYRLAMSPENARGLLLTYARRINGLAQKPDWYNAITHNCTTSIRLHTTELDIQQPWNWRVLVNGFGEELLHMRGMVNTSLPFEELRARSDITEAARAAGDATDFSTQIRAGIPARPVAQLGPEPK